MTLIVMCAPLNTNPAVELFVRLMAEVKFGGLGFDTKDGGIIATWFMVGSAYMESCLSNLVAASCRACALVTQAESILYPWIVILAAER